MYEEGSDGDTEWLAENYTNLLVESCHEKNLVSSSECSFSDSEDEGIVEEPENPNQSDEDEYDYEDLDDKFYMTNQEEDEVLLRFRNWLISVDGGTKLPIQAQTAKRILMSIVRHNGSKGIDYKFTVCLSFLNSWMTKLRNEEKEPGTIRTYLNSVKHFIDFCEAEDNHILDG